MCVAAFSLSSSSVEAAYSSLVTPASACRDSSSTESCSLSGLLGIIDDAEAGRDRPRDAVFDGAKVGGGHRGGAMLLPRFRSANRLPPGQAPHVCGEHAIGAAAPPQPRLCSPSLETECRSAREPVRLSGWLARRRRADRRRCRDGFQGPALPRRDPCRPSPSAGEPVEVACPIPRHRRRRPASSSRRDGTVRRAPD